jgi:hypothetical protein
LTNATILDIKALNNGTFNKAQTAETISSQSIHLQRPNQKMKNCTKLLKMVVWNRRKPYPDISMKLPKPTGNKQGKTQEMGDLLS